MSNWSGDPDGGAGSRMHREERDDGHSAGVRRLSAGSSAGSPAMIGGARRLDPPGGYGGGWAPEAEPAAGSELSRLLEVLRLRRRLVAQVTVIVLASVAIGTFLQEPVYRATGMVEFRKYGAEVLPLDALFEVARIPDQHLETQYGLLRSPALARRVVAELGLRDPDDFSSRRPQVQAGLASSDPVAESLIRAFGARLDVEPVADSRMVQVSFESGDAALAAGAVNTMFSSYTALRVEAARGAVERLADQVDSVRAKLARSEERLQQYVRANELLLVENSSGETENMVQERLRQLQQQLTEAEADRYSTESRYDLVRRSNHDALASDVLRELSLRVAELQGEYARLRTIFTDEYPRTRELKRQLDALTAQLGRERVRIAAEVRGEHLSAVRRQELLQQAFDEQKALADRLASRTAEYRVLKRDVEGHQQLFAVLQQKQKEAGVSMALAPAEISVVDAAFAPEDPVRPSPARNLPLGLIAGLLLGVGAAFLREHTDPAIQSVEEVEGSGGGVRILGLIPAASGWPDRPALGRLSTLPLPKRIRGLLPPGEPVDAIEPCVRIDREDPYDSPLAEAFGSLRTAVLLAADGPLPHSLLVTSGQPGEGKTTVAVNLAISMARLGRRALLIDADVRRPSVHRSFGIPAGPGLADYLSGHESWRELLRPQALGRLHILPSGAPPERPSELLASDRMQQLLQDAESEYELVIVDSPALLVNVPDARILAPLMGGIVLVVRSGVTPRVLLRRVLKQAPNLIGVVVNDLDPDRLPGYYASYAAAEPGAEERARTWRETLRQLAQAGHGSPGAHV